MMKISEIINEVEDALGTLESGYTPEQWKYKEEIDSLRYAEAKSLKAKIDDAIYYDTIEYDVDVDDAVMDDLNELLDRLDTKIINYEECQLY